MKFEIKMSHLLLIIGVIIFIIPTIAVLPALIRSFDFSTTGQIGDTIGGITSPFINAIGAVLVYLAFKEQIRANKLIMEQQMFQHVQEQIHRLEEDFMNVDKAIDEVLRSLEQSRAIQDYSFNDLLNYRIDNKALYKIIYTMTLFVITNTIFEKMTSNKGFLFEKLRIIYVMIYQYKYARLHLSLQDVKNIDPINEHNVNLFFYLVSDLEKTFSKVDISNDVLKTP